MPYGVFVFERLPQNAGHEVDLAILEFLDRAIGNASIDPQRQAFGPAPALRELAEGLDPAGRVFVPDRVIARKRQSLESLSILTRTLPSFEPDRIQRCLCFVIARENLRELLRIIRVLGSVRARHALSRTWSDRGRWWRGIGDDCFMRWRVRDASGTHCGLRVTPARKAFRDR